MSSRSDVKKWNQKILKHCPVLCIEIACFYSDQLCLLLWNVAHVSIGWISKCCALVSTCQLNYNIGGCRCSGDEIREAATRIIRHLCRRDVSEKKGMVTTLRILCRKKSCFLLSLSYQIFISWSHFSSAQRG